MAVGYSEEENAEPFKPGNTHESFDDAATEALELHVDGKAGVILLRSIGGESWISHVAWAGRLNEAPYHRMRLDNPGDYPSDAIDPK